MGNRSFEDFIFKHVSPRSVRHIRQVGEGDASDLVAQVYRQMNREFVLGPPITLHSPIPEVLAGVWIASRESLIAGSADRGQQIGLSAR